MQDLSLFQPWCMKILLMKMISLLTVQLVLSWKNVSFCRQAFGCEVSGEVFFCFNKSKKNSSSTFVLVSANTMTRYSFISRNYSESGTCLSISGTGNISFADVCKIKVLSDSHLQTGTVSIIPNFQFLKDQ